MTSPLNPNPPQRRTINSRSERQEPRKREQEGQRTRSELGQALPLVALLLPLLLSVAGLALDGGAVFAARRELQNVADSAARAGAAEVSVEHFRETGGGVRLIPQAARATAEVWVLDYNASRRPEQRVALDGPITVAQDWIMVRVSRRAQTAFVRLFGIEDVQVSAEAIARAQSGGE